MCDKISSEIQYVYVNDGALKRIEIEVQKTTKYHTLLYSHKVAFDSFKRSDGLYLVLNDFGPC